MTLDILQKPVHNVHFELKSQSKGSRRKVKPGHL